jgi:hypothetical protein
MYKQPNCVGTYTHPFFINQYTDAFLAAYEDGTASTPLGNASVATQLEVLLNTAAYQ